MKEKYFIETGRLGLRALMHSDIEGSYRDWLNDCEVCQFNSHHRFPQSKEMLSFYVDSVNRGKDCMVFALIEKEKRQHIGNISLQVINYIDRSAEMAIIIGEKEFWGKGYAYEAAKVILQHGFIELNLHRIYLGTSDSNIGMQKLALKLGFAQEGCRKEALYKNGIYHDILEYGLLREQYMKSESK